MNPRKKHSKIKEILDEGKKLIVADNYADALRIFAKAFMLEPRNKTIKLYIMFLWQRINESNYDFEPQTPEEFISRGNARLYKGEYERAQDDYSKAIALDNKCDNAYWCRGLLMAELGKHAEAHKDYSVATRLRPDRGEYWDVAATSFEALGDVKQAHLCHEQAVRASPDDPRLWYNYGLFFAQYLNDAKEALKKINKAIELWPGFDDAIVNRDYLLDMINGK